MRWTASLALAGLTLWWIEPERLAAHLQSVDGGWLLAGLALSVPMYLLAAVRWWWTARAIDAEVPIGRALSEYYLSTFLNQVLPLGVAGDAARTYRHTRHLQEHSDRESAFGPALRSVVLDRLAGQVAMALFMLVAALFWWRWGQDRLALVGALAGVLVLALVPVLIVLRVRSSEDSALGSLARDAQRALWGRRSLLVQLSLSSGKAACLLLLFLCAAKATNQELSSPLVLALVPMVLGATTLPVAFAGWGLRELTTAGLFEMAGLDPALGVAASVSYGVLSLVASAPGLLVLAAPDSGRLRDNQALYPLFLLAGTGLAVWIRDARPFALVTVLGLVARSVGAAVSTDAAPLLRWANVITWGRLLCVATLSVVALDREPMALAVLAAVIFVADALDGFVARRLDQSSEYGAMIDMECDAAFVMMLSLLLWQVQGMAAWVLVAGLWRYVYAIIVAIAAPLSEAPRSQLARYVFSVLVLGMIGGFAFEEPLRSVSVAIGVVAVSASFLRSFFYSWRPS